MLQLLEALSFAHERHIAHLDIKVRTLLTSSNSHNDEIKTHYWNLFVDSKNALPPLFVSADRFKIIYLYFLFLNVGWAALKVFI